MVILRAPDRGHRLVRRVPQLEHELILAQVGPIVVELGASRRRVAGVASSRHSTLCETIHATLRASYSSTNRPALYEMSHGFPQLACRSVLPWAREREHAERRTSHRSAHASSERSTGSRTRMACLCSHWATGAIQRPCCAIAAQTMSECAAYSVSFARRCWNKSGRIRRIGCVVRSQTR